MNQPAPIYLYSQLWRGDELLLVRELVPQVVVHCKVILLHGLARRRQNKSTPIG